MRFYGIAELTTLAFCALLYSTNLAASSFESQQKNTTIFDGVKGEQGELTLDFSQATHTWKSPVSQVLGSSSAGFAFRKMSGDFILTVQLKSNQSPDSKSGAGIQLESPDGSLSLKTKLDTQSNIYLELSSDKVVYLPRSNSVKSPDVLQLERTGNDIIFSAAVFGKPLKLVSRYTLTDLPIVDVGIYRSFNSNEKYTLEMRNLRWVIPEWKNFVPYVDYLGSRLEILDVETGERRVIYETPAGIEAPNWTADGENIIYNSSGRVYRLYLPTKKVSLVNTGFEIKSNNDHIVSFKGKTLGITHLDKGVVDRWIIYKLPLSGGEPEQLTFKTPSYLHGWSPDGRYILYTSVRDGQFEIFRGSTDGTGEELQLTNNKFMDDGSEYSPDGNYIYFNSTRSGAMRIWRMDADGKHPKQVTQDNFNDWFPHVSPDGKQLVFLSFLPDIAPELHPYNQHVYLRSISTQGGESKVLAYLYGGQGTINVPSWSPDGRYVAFVSNSQLGTEKH